MVKAWVYGVYKCVCIYITIANGFYETTNITREHHLVSPSSEHH